MVRYVSIMIVAVITISAMPLVELVKDEEVHFEGTAKNEDTHKGTVKNGGGGSALDKAVVDEGDLPDQCRDVELGLCKNDLENKIPAVDPKVRAGGKTHLSQKDDLQETYLEILMAQGLQNTELVKWALEAYKKTMKSFFEKLASMMPDGSELEGKLQSFGMRSGGALDTKLETFFSGDSCDSTMAGVVGKEDISAVMGSSNEGNLREVMGLWYCSNKAGNFNNLLNFLVETHLSAHDGTNLLHSLGMDVDGVQHRYNQIVGSRDLPKPFKFSQGMLDFFYPPFKSWCRFKYFAVEPGNSDGAKIWGNASAVKGYCNQPDMYASDPSLQPPLSDREAIMQCPGCSPERQKERDFQLQWCTGDSAWKMRRDQKFQTRDGSTSAGFAERAATLGYRTVAGPSGATTNFMMYMKHLGASPADLVAYRALMIAWMVPIKDHSFFEIMVAADVFVDPKYRTNMQTKTFDQVLSETLVTSDGTTFHNSEVQKAVKGRLAAELKELEKKQSDILELM